MLQFGYALPNIRLHIEQDLALRNFENENTGSDRKSYAENQHPNWQ
jgi:DNA topoisomerase-1